MHATLRKMKVSLEQPVRYALRLGDEHIHLNPFLGKKISLHFSGEIRCVNCDGRTKKSFSQGYCYPCCQKLAECDMCILRPETCHFDKGTCRDEAWAQDHCMRPHYVYLANSSGLKIGITRETQIPTRWIDQGAAQAIPLFKVQTRYQSGLIEILGKAHVSDKTNWRTLLKGPAEPKDMVAEAKKLMTACAPGIDELRQKLGASAIETLEAPPVSITYPVTSYPKKITSLNFDKHPLVSGTLMGIKGQYLLLDSGVINLRKFTGYLVQFEGDR